MSRSKVLSMLSLAGCLSASLVYADDTITVAGSDETSDQIANQTI